ncbi:macro domain-containing protein XCC3184-like [Dioscorea cayenensis subsp. rotundata]|uniref:Macro domain-containing protein XCC3184-like n=1 Tax=Dioscorea cayennensis subsp. rotundata TaxID=55577 RepID=A0AB40BLD8_DIOCR|nr:macro domain-containing protein XCC3184-like [Dioscorea cayenensis subsp. rotundata]
MSSLVWHAVSARALQSINATELLFIVPKFSSFSSHRFPKTSTILSMMQCSGRDPARVSILSSDNGREFSDKLVSFDLSPSTTLKLHKGDITLWSIDGSTDAIVNAAEELMLGGGGVDGAIHRAAGPQLVEACREVPEVRPGVRCPTGEARITPAFLLPVSHVIHTVGPIYGKHDQPEVLLANAYRNSLKIAKENKIQYIAFPAISCGVYRYPHNEASRVAISTIKECSDGLKEVHFVLFSDTTYSVWLESAYELLK